MSRTFILSKYTQNLLFFYEGFAHREPGVVDNAREPRGARGGALHTPKPLF